MGNKKVVWEERGREPSPYPDSMKEMMKKLMLTLVATVSLLGCTRTAQEVTPPQRDAWQAPALPEKGQELILDRAVQLMRESGRWQGYPLRSLGFDKQRKQWKLVFGTDRPDEGYAVFIDNENAERIDILLLPPVWTKYERTKASNTRSEATR